MSDEEPERFANDDGHPVAKVGLRSLREERAPESSMKATLAALRGASPTDAPARSAALTFLAWALVGGVIAALIAWLLFFR